MIGQTLSHYRITAKLGHGGMGEVYRAEDIRLKREVALKVLPEDLAGSQERLARFRREAETVASLNHPNIVTLHSVEEDQGVHFLTMELVDGESLDQMIPAAGLPLERIFEIAIPMVDALSSAHERGIVHRDLKPANVMVTDEGRVKILDFGLAKLNDEPEVAEGSGEEATQALTEEGKVLGTVPYMSPEQVQGHELDARSDIFSLGVLLYEMATGARPFAGQTSADLISSILRDRPSSVTELKGELPHHLGRIVGHCLEKDLKRRYQSALDVRNELEILKREIETGVVHTHSESAAVAAVPPRTVPRWVIAAGAGVLVVALALLGWRLLAPATEPDSAPAPVTGAESVGTAGQKSLAVFFFDNLSGDADLDWLRTGLAEMLVTDLSQSPDLRVLPTNRLHEILADMKQLDQRIESFEVIREVADQADADTVVTGSFARMGETIRISIKIQQADTGEILVAHSVDARDQDDLFARVDDLSRNIRQSIELPEAPDGAEDRNLADVTTSSVEAYRLFVEAEALRHGSNDADALPLLEEAVALDPEFAVAWVKLAWALQSEARLEERDEALETAMENLDRLTEPERAYVEHAYYGIKLGTYGRAIDTAESALASYPHLTTLRYNLALTYESLGMDKEALEHVEQAIEDGLPWQRARLTRSAIYLRFGDSERAVAISEAALRDAPDDAWVLQEYGDQMMTLGRQEEAEIAYAKLATTQPDFILVPMNDFSIKFLREDWEAALRIAAAAEDSPHPLSEMFASVFYGLVALFQGQRDAAVGGIERVADAQAELGEQFAFVLPALSQQMANLGEQEKALELAQQTRQEGAGDWPEYDGRLQEILAQQRLGRARRADLLVEELEEALADVRGPKSKWYGHLARGELSREREQWHRAIEELTAAAAAATVHSSEGVTTRFLLGRALFEAGRPVDAAERFKQVTGATWNAIEYPTQYVRSFDYLGRIYAELGNRLKAREHYETFLRYWGDGDLDRDRVEAARAFLASS